MQKQDTVYRQADSGALSDDLAYFKDVIKVIQGKLGLVPDGRRTVSLRRYTDGAALGAKGGVGGPSGAAQLALRADSPPLGECAQRVLRVVTDVLRMQYAENTDVIRK